MPVLTPNLIELFAQLAVPDAQRDHPNRLSALPIAGSGEHRLGKDLNGAPALLLSTRDSDERSPLANIALEHLVVQHNAECQVSYPHGEKETRKFSVIRCPTGDRMLQNYFLTVAVPILGLIGESPTQSSVTEAIERFVELFRQMTQPPHKSVQGLWAELFCIARTTDPAFMLNCWHLTPEEEYDFGHDVQRLEVKSSSLRVRQHYFSLAQLSPPTRTTVLFASLFVERAGGGASLIELSERIRKRVSRPELLFRLDKVVGLTLGNSWRSASEERFDYELAAESLAFYECDVIPSVCRELPPGVSEVRFKADLTDCRLADRQFYRNQGGLFGIALRK